MKRLLCLLVCLLLPCALAEESAYQGDGWCMLTVLRDTALCQEPGGAEMTQLPEGARTIVTREMLATGGQGERWYQVYLPEQGYGWVSGDAVQLDEAKQITYQPGFGVSVGLFTVEDPAQYRVEVTSLDNLEYPVVELMWIWHKALPEGGYQLVGAFSTAGDVCATLRENLCATLYDQSGQPVEVLLMTFDAPLWRR